MSRNKGSAFERAVAKELELLTGIRFARNLEQTRAQDQSDLIPDSEDWPFALELKVRADGHDCLDAWKDQARKAAAKLGRYPCVIFKFDRRPIRVAVPFNAIGAAVGWEDKSDEWANLTLPGFAHLAAELMAARALARADE